MATTKEDSLNQQPTLEEMNEVYDRYIKPLEKNHWDEFVAVTRDGRMMLSRDVRELTFSAKDALGPGSFVFKIGPRAVGRI